MQWLKQSKFQKITWTGRKEKSILFVNSPNPRFYSIADWIHVCWVSVFQNSISILKFQKIASTIPLRKKIAYFQFFTPFRYIFSSKCQLWDILTPICYQKTVYIRLLSSGTNLYYMLVKLWYSNLIISLNIELFLFSPPLEMHFEFNMTLLSCLWAEMLP